MIEYKDIVNTFKLKKDDIIEEHNSYKKKIKELSKSKIEHLLNIYKTSVEQLKNSCEASLKELERVKNAQLLHLENRKHAELQVYKSSKNNSKKRNYEESQSESDEENNKKQKLNFTEKQSSLINSLHIPEENLNLSYLKSEEAKEIPNFENKSPTAGQQNFVSEYQDDVQECQKSFIDSSDNVSQESNSNLETESENACSSKFLDVLFPRR